MSVQSTSGGTHIIASSEFPAYKREQERQGMVVKVITRDRYGKTEFRLHSVNQSSDSSMICCGLGIVVGLILVFGVLIIVV